MNNIVYSIEVIDKLKAVINIFSGIRKIIHISYIYCEIKIDLCNSSDLSELLQIYRL